MLEDAFDVMDRFYDDYRPKVYYRTDNLRNSYHGYVKRAGGNSSGFKREAVVEFSTKYMKHDFHAIVNGKTPYKKDEVMYYDFDNGWHGAPFYKKVVKKRTLPPPKERMDKFTKILVHELKTGKWSKQMDGAFEKAFLKIVSKVDKKISG